MKKIKIVLAVFILLFCRNVNAELIIAPCPNASLNTDSELKYVDSIKETTNINDEYDTIERNTTIIGVTKFSPNEIITASKAAQAGANDALVYMNKYDTNVGYESPNIYIYYGEVGGWYSLDENNTTTYIADSTKLEEMNIYFVDNIKKFVKVNGDSPSCVTEDVVYLDGKTYINSSLYKITYETTTTDVHVTLGERGGFYTDVLEQKNCYFDGELVDNALYSDGTYNYIYKSNLGGWKVELKDKESTKPVFEQMCSFVNHKPIVDLSSTYESSNASLIDLRNINTSNVINMDNILNNSHATKVLGYDNLDKSSLGNTMNSCLRINGREACNESLTGYTDAVTYLSTKYNEGTNNDGIIIDDYNNLRYQGSVSSTKNYAYFNCSNNYNPTPETCEIWKIVGVFDVKKSNNSNIEKRIKLVRDNSLGAYSWDTSDNSINNGFGVKKWDESDLYNELNGDYLTFDLDTYNKWFTGKNDSKGKILNRNYVLKESSQFLIDNAIWYLDYSYDDNTITKTYDGERKKNNVCETDFDGDFTCYSVNAKVGLIYPSDYGYASADSNCRNDITNSTYCKSNNWLFKSGQFGTWTISPSKTDGSVRSINYQGGMKDEKPYLGKEVFPSVYLTSGILIKGDGTLQNPYRFA